jgi:hypothetical protein
MDFRKIPNVTLECVIFGLHDSGLKILLSRRKLDLDKNKDFNFDDWVITGDHLQKSENLTEAAKRIIGDYIPLNHVYFEQFNTFGNPDRVKEEKDLTWLKKLDVSPRLLSVGFISLVKAQTLRPKKDNIDWFSIHELPELGFDHEKIIKNAYESLQKKVLIEPLIFELLPVKFTLNELQLGFEAILNIKLDNRNFRKKVLKMKYIVQLDEKRKGASKKPANLYIFSRDIYDRIVEKHQLFFF